MGLVLQQKREREREGGREGGRGREGRGDSARERERERVWCLLTCVVEDDVGSVVGENSDEVLGQQRQVDVVPSPLGETNVQCAPLLASWEEVSTS